MNGTGPVRSPDGVPDGVFQSPAANGGIILDIRPLILNGAGINDVAATYKSVHGLISSAWTTNTSGITLDVTIPANTTATIYVPGTDPSKITESGMPASRAPGVTYVGATLDAVKYTVGSGTYRFSTRGTAATGGRGSK